MHKEFTAMRAEFGIMLYKIQVVIEKHQPPMLDSLKNSFLGYSYPDIASQLSASKSINDVLSLVQKKCSLTNIELLHKMVVLLELKEAEEHIKDYKKEIEEFCKKTQAHFCLNETFQVSVPHTPLKCEAITFVIDLNPDNFTLEDANNLLSDAFDKLSDKVLVVSMKDDKSITILCTFPVHIAMLLIAKAFDNLETLKQRFGLLSLTIGYVTLWNKQNRDEVNKVTHVIVYNIHVESQTTSRTSRSINRTKRW